MRDQVQVFVASYPPPPCIYYRNVSSQLSIAAIQEIFCVSWNVLRNVFLAHLKLQNISKTVKAPTQPITESN